MNDMFDTNSPLVRMLRWIEKFTKTDMVYLAHGSFWLFVGQIVYSLAAFILALALANFLPKETYGTYKFILSIAALFSIFTLPGIVTALSRAAAQGNSGSLITAIRTRMRGGMVGLVIGLFVALYYYFAGNYTLAAGIAIIALFLPLFDPLSTFMGYLSGAKRFKEITYISLVTQMVSVGFLVLAAFFSGNVLVLLLAYFIPATLMRLYLSRRTIARLPVGPSDPKVSHYGFHLSAMNVLSEIATQADDIILFHFLGPVSVAMYSVAIAPTEQVKGFMNAINTLLFPRLAAQNEHVARNGLAYKALLVFLGSLVVVGFYVLIVPYFFRIFFPRYIDAVFLSQLYSVSLLAFISSPAISFLQAHAKIKEQYLINIASSIFQIIAMILGTIWWGVVGLVIARVVTRLFIALLSIFFTYVPLQRRHADPLS